MKTEVSCSRYLPIIGVELFQKNIAKISRTVPSCAASQATKLKNSLFYTVDHDNIIVIIIIIKRRQGQEGEEQAKRSYDDENNKVLLVRKIRNTYA